MKANWDEIPSEVVRPGVTRRGFGNDEVMLVMNYCEPGMELKPHKHDDFDQIALFTKGRAIYTVGKTRHEVGPGDVLLIPAGGDAPHRAARRGGRPQPRPLRAAAGRLHAPARLDEGRLEGVR